jgi:hypothetical protein
MKVNFKATVVREYQHFGSIVYELDNVTNWKLVDTPLFSGVNKDVIISKQGRDNLMQFSGSKEKYVVDEM